MFYTRKIESLKHLKGSVFLQYKTYYSMNDAFFKIRPSKRSNPEARTTLDALHHSQIQGIEDEQNNLDELYNRLEKLKVEQEACQVEYMYEKLEKDKNSINEKIDKILKKDNLYDYYLKTGDLLYQYYDVQDKIATGKETTIRKSKPGSILAILEAAEADASPEVSQPAKKTMQRDKLLEKYIQIVEPDHARTIAPLEAEGLGECVKCFEEMILSQNEAILYCQKCGHVDPILIDSDKPSYKDPPREISYYAYKRINHFNEWLAQFQAKESTEIPQEVFDSILVELKKERMLNMGHLKKEKLRDILRKLKLNKYYDHIPHIINRLNGQNAPVMSRETEEKLRYMFREIQPSFQKHKPVGRNNFLSYSYILYKFCELLELDEYLPCFPLLKNRDNLYKQDKIWEKICQDLRWEFIRSV